MTINFSTNKDGISSLYVNYESLSNSDSIYWDEAVIFRDEDKITIFGIISSASRGVVSYKDRNWRPDFQECTLKIYAKKKSQWDTASSKFITVDVGKEEAHLYLVLLTIQTTNSNNAVLRGPLNPWLNPFFWDLNLSDPASDRIGEQFVKQLHQLTLHPNPSRLSVTQIQPQEASVKKLGGGGNWAKGETELERLIVRSQYLESQGTLIFDYKSLYDLASQIEAMKNEPTTPDILLCRTMDTLLELIKIIMGN
ncbi:MAG TPA: hypothetical protein DDZ60_03835 [Planktothrix sp. UBA10369]|nr:hypothetical protein [Planktothrix sp. UBA10369]